MTGAKVGLAMRVGLGAAFLSLAFCVYNGLREGPSLLRDALNPLQLIVAISQLAYAVFALLALVGWWRRRAWTRAVLAAWSVAVATVSGAASVAWEESPQAWIAAVSALAAAAVSAAVAWLIHRHLRMLA